MKAAAVYMKPFYVCLVPAAICTEAVTPPHLLPSPSLAMRQDALSFIPMTLPPAP